jgi:hypothetical protein
MLSCILSYYVKYCDTLLLQHMFVKKLIYLLIEIHQIFLKHAVSCHFNNFENFEGIV